MRSDSYVWIYLSHNIIPVITLSEFVEDTVVVYLNLMQYQRKNWISLSEMVTLDLIIAAYDVLD